MNTVPKFYIGTTNPFKIREIASILRPLEIPLVVTDPIDPEETGVTFEENATIKAVAYATYVRDQLVNWGLSQHNSREGVENFLRMSRTWTICEDSGIEIPVLGGLPGPYSARFDDCTIRDGKVVSHEPSKRTREQIDRLNNLRILNMMQDVVQPYRVAVFTVSMMVADIDGQILFKTTNSVTGWIAEEMRGDQGFGYDPIFISDKSFGKTYAEIDSMRKNLISHRRKALQALTVWLATQIRT